MTEKTSSLIIDVKPGEAVSIDGPAKVELVHKSGHYARLRFIAPSSVRIKKQQEKILDTSMAT